MTTTLFQPTKATIFNENDGMYRKKWTVQECRFLTDNGLLEAGKFELLDGEITYKMPQGRKHISVVSLVSDWLRVVFPRSVQSQGPIGIGQTDEYSDPEPDVAVVRGEVTDYSEKEPDPATDILLCVEVSKTTLAGDKTTKARIYGKQGIPEYWIVAIEKRELLIHRAPDIENGGYSDVRTYAETDTVSPLEKPDALIRIADLLP